MNVATQQKFVEKTTKRSNISARLRQSHVQLSHCNYEASMSLSQLHRYL